MQGQTSAGSHAACQGEGGGAAVESHPFEPFLPSGATLLMLGTFPPAEKRWCMKFYYPNFTNDMWRIFGLCFFADKMYFVDHEAKSYKLGLIQPFLKEKGVAMYDTAQRVVRTKNTASDKDLLIVEKADLDGMLRRLPHCKAVVTAGRLATSVFCSHFGQAEPKVGGFVEFVFAGRTLRLYRMPSSSRAYPMSVERKADYYKEVFAWAGTMRGNVKYKNEYDK